MTFFLRSTYRLFQSIFKRDSILVSGKHSFGIFKVIFSPCICSQGFFLNYVVCSVAAPFKTGSVRGFVMSHLSFLPILPCCETKTKIVICDCESGKKGRKGQDRKGRNRQTTRWKLSKKFQTQAFEPDTTVSTNSNLFVTKSRQ